MIGIFQVNPLPSFAVTFSADENCPYSHISHAKFVEVQNQDFVVVSEKRKCFARCRDSVNAFNQV